MGHTMKQQAAADVATPASGKATVFIDSTDGVVKAKLPNGTVPEPGGSSGNAALTPVAWALLQLGADTESILHQVGDVITGLNVIGPGEYELTLDPDAGLSNGNRLGVQLAVMGSNISGQERFASYFPSLVGNTITVYVFDAAGAGQPAARATITLWYDSTPEPP